MHAGDHAALRAWLQPWYQPLRDRGWRSQRDDATVATVRVEHNYGQPCRLNTSFLEGMALLALLARLDPDACRRIIEDIWPSRGTAQGPVDDARDAPLTVVIDWMMGEIDHLDVLREFVDSAQDQSPAFEAAMQSINAYKPLDHASAGKPPCICVSIDSDVDCDDSDQLTRALEAIYILATCCHRSAGVCSVRFKIELVYNLLACGPSLGEAALELVGKMLDLGIRFDEVPVFNNELAERHNATLLVKTVRSLLLPVTTSSSGLHMVSVAPNSSLKVAESVLTAVQHNMTANDFRLRWQADLNDGEVLPWGHNEKLWELISWCLFSHHAQHTIRSLDLDLDGFDEESLDGVRAGLEDVELDSRPEDNHQITAARFHLDDPIRLYKEGWEQHTPVVYENPTSITTRVLEHFFTPDNIEWRCCLLPGWSRAWVPAEDVLAVVVDDKNDQTRTYRSPSFDEITVSGMSEESLESTAELLDIIGRGTWKLTVSNDSLDAMDEWASAVLVNCPALEELQFDRGNFPSLEAFVDCAVSGHSLLQRLSLASVSYVNPDHVLVFFRSLCDPYHALTIHLQELRVEFDFEELMESGFESLVAVLAEMLEVNRTLRDVSISCPLLGDLGVLRPVLESKLSRFTTEQVAVQTGLLDLRCKLAFLGVLQETTATSSTTLDSRIIGSIFKYAAPAVTRVFRLAVC